MKTIHLSLSQFDSVERMEKMGEKTVDEQKMGVTLLTPQAAFSLSFETTKLFAKRWKSNEKKFT